MAHSKKQVERIPPPLMWSLAPHDRRALADRPVLVTGATGLIGRHLVRALADCGAAPLAVVRPGREHAVPNGVRTIVWDLAQRGQAREIPRELAAVVHLAAPRNRLTPGLARFPPHIRLAVDAAARLYATAEARGARQVIAASTIAAFGPATQLLAADRRARFDAGPAHPYAVTRRWAEDLALQARCYLRNVTIVRPGPVYGPGQSEFGLLQGFVHRLRRGQPIKLAAPRGRLVSPVFVGDVVYVLLASLARPTNDTFTIGGPDARRERTLVEDLATWLGRRARVHVDRTTRPARFATDQTEVDRVFPERPRTPWTVGLGLTWRKSRQ